MTANYLDSKVMTANYYNMADFIRENAKKYPYKRAIVIPTSRDHFGHAAYSSLTFKQLEEETNRFARGFSNEK